MDEKKKITTGANDRPRNETIAQSGPGLPDDSSQPPEASDEAVERARKSLGEGAASGQPQQQANSDRVPEGTPSSGENICRRCSGTGRIDGGTCPDCGGSGVVTTPVGGAG